MAIRGLSKIMELNFTSKEFKKKNKNKNKNDKPWLPAGPQKYCQVAVLSLISALPPGEKGVFQLLFVSCFACVKLINCFLCIDTVAGRLAVPVFRSVLQMKMLEKGFDVKDIMTVSDSHGTSNGYFRGLQYTQEFRDICAANRLSYFVGIKKDKFSVSDEDFYKHCKNTYDVEYGYPAMVYKNLLTIKGLYPLPTSNSGM